MEQVGRIARRVVKKLTLKAPTLKEWHEQRKVFDWAKAMEPKYPKLRLLNASMNGLQVSNPAVIVKAKLCGLKKGYPDIFLPVIGYGGCPGLFIELKRPNGGKPSPEQEQWEEWLDNEGYSVVTCYGAEKAIQTIKQYLGIEE